MYNIYTNFKFSFLQGESGGSARISDGGIFQQAVAINIQQRYTRVGVYSAAVFGYIKA